MKLFGFYITRINWKYLFEKGDAWSLNLHSDIASLELRNQSLIIANKCLWEKIDKLKAELEKARFVKESDGRLRDTVTGRYLKKKDPIVEASKAPMDYETIKKAGK